MEINVPDIVFREYDENSKENTGYKSDKFLVESDNTRVSYSYHFRRKHFQLVIKMKGRGIINELPDEELINFIREGIAVFSEVEKIVKFVDPKLFVKMSFMMFKIGKPTIVVRIKPGPLAEERINLNAFPSIIKRKLLESFSEKKSLLDSFELEREDVAFKKNPPNLSHRRVQIDGHQHMVGHSEYSSFGAEEFEGSVLGTFLTSRSVHPSLVEMDKFELSNFVLDMRRVSLALREVTSSDDVLVIFKRLKGRRATFNLVPRWSDQKEHFQSSNRKKFVKKLQIALR